MDEKLRVRLEGYLDALERAGQKAVDLAGAEIPEFVREWLLWTAVENGLFAIAAAVLAVGGNWWLGRVGLPFLYGKFAADAARDQDVWGAVICAAWFVRIMLTVIAIVEGSRAGMTCLKTLVAPRVVIVEKVAKLVKSSK